MRKLQANNKRLVPLILCSVLVLQQSLANQASAGMVTDVNGNAIPTHPGTGAYELRPDAINKDALVGFKQFQDFKLSEGEIANFIFQALQHGRGPNGEQQHIFTDINTFVNFVQNQGEIKGIVNAVQSLGGGLKSDGNLVFISPNGMIVGSSGVLNVGSLQVLTPSVGDFDKMRNGIPDPNYTNFSDGSTHVLAQDINKTYNPADPMARSGSGQISIDGKVYARGDVELAGGKVGVGNGGLLIAGLGNNTQVLKNQNAADTLFNSLVNVDNMNTGNGFANANGKIVITSNVGTKVDAGGAIKNFGANSSTTITNTGTEGIQINGEVSNPNGNLTITNKAGALNVGNTGELKNKGTMTITNEENGTGLTIDGTATNDGTLNITNSSGDNGLNIGGKVTNNTGAATILNQKGGLNVNDGATVTSNGTSLDMDNYGSDGFNIDGDVISNAGTADLYNHDNVFNINSTGSVTSNGTDLNITNDGTNGLNIAGEVLNNSGTANILNTEGGLNVKTDGLVQSDGDALNMTNRGQGGFNIDGSVLNNEGMADLLNTAGGLNVNADGTVTSNGTSLDMTNNGADGLNIEGKVLNNSGTANILNTEGGLNVKTGGLVQSDGDALNMTNQGNGGFIVDGTIQNNKNIVTLTNEAGAFNVNAGGQVISNGTKLAMTNSGAGGLNIAGLVDNNAGEAGISNINTDAGLNVLNGGRVSNAGTKLLMSNSGNQGLNIAGTVESTAGSTEINNMGGGLHVTDTGLVENSGASLDMNNTGDGGFTIDGTVNNNSGTADLYNENNKLLISSTGRINSKGSELNVTNKGTNGMHIQGIVKHQNTNGKVNFVNQDSNMVIGHETTEFNIDSDADVNIKVTDGNILNYGVPKTLIRTTNKADLNMDVLNGSIGEDLGLCDGGICTGVGPGERDLTKSINTEVDGSITAYSKGNGVLINIASLDKDMHVNKIHSDGKVILLADDKLNKGATAYDIINTADDNTVDPNLKGNAISAIASGNIGENKDNKLTFIQTGATVDIANENDDASKPHELYDTPKISANGGVEFLAIGDVNIKGLDNADGTKNDTNVCTIASRTGSVNAEFSGNTYIRDITAQNEVNVVNRGPEIYIENLGGAPSRYAETGDYYGNYDGIVPERANIKALDLGTVENPNHTPNSTIVIKNGTINGKGSTSHPGLDQDVTVTADNAYVGGYYFNMGKHRYDDPNNPQGLTTVTKDDHTNKLVNAGDPNTDVSIRGKAVRPDDVTEIGRNPIERDYYYADLDGDGEPDDGYDPGESGSGQKDDPTFDPDKETGDDLVVPVPGDDDDDGPVPGDDDDDDDGPVPGDDDDDDDGPVPGDDDDDDDGPVPGDDDDDDDGPIPGDDDDGPEPIPPTPTPDFPDMDAAKQTWKKEYNDYISVIDKRQNIRFDITTNQNPVVFESSPEVGGLLNISRGGVQLTHNKSLKVGDIIPVHIQYGDVEVNANVKIVSASDVTAGAEFVDLDQATANKLLYLSLLKDDGGQPKEEYYANTNYIENENLSTTGVDD